MTDLGGAAKGDPNKEIEQGETVIKSAKEVCNSENVFDRSDNTHEERGMPQAHDQHCLASKSIS